MKILERLFSNLNKGPRVIVAFILFSWISNCNRFYPPMDIILGGILCIAAIIWISCSFIYKTPKQQEADRQKEVVRFAQDERAARQAAEKETECLRRAEWDKSHGCIFTRIAGVTFANPDGSSRQAYLKAAYEDDCAGDMQLDTYTYNGEDAIRVLYEGRELGNIPRDAVHKVLEVFDRIENAQLDVTTFEPDDWDEDPTRHKPSLIYRADLTIIYSK